MSVLRIMGWAVLILFALLAVPIGAIGIGLLESSHNRGWEFGYFGEFNRVRHILLSLPGISIKEEWSNNDLTLEEFAFKIEVERRPVLLEFSEANPVRTMPRDSARAELKRWIAEELRRPATLSPQGIAKLQR